MELFNLKMAFAAFLLMSLHMTITRAGVAQQEVSVNKDYFPSYDYAALKKFVQVIKRRISFGEAVAIYKWENGEPILDREREKSVIIYAEQIAKTLNKPFGEDEKLFITDIMEATKLLEYALVSDWYATESKGKTPTDSVSLDETRKQINEMLVEIMSIHSKLKSLQKSENCQELLAQAIGETETQNSLLLRGLQRAFGNYCKKQIAHKL
ncbi:secreted chorismate mutase-like isoform X2 [Lycorma delicatula]